MSSVRQKFSLIFTLLSLLAGAFFVTGCKGYGDKTVKLTLKISIADFIRNIASDSADAGLNKALADANKITANRDTAFIPVFAAIYRQQHPGYNLAKLFVKAAQHSISASSTDEEVLSVLSAQATESVKRTFRVLQSRVAASGDENSKTELNAQSGLVKVEMRTTMSASRLLSYLLSTGDLQFFETWTNPDFYPYLSAANDTLTQLLFGTAKPGKQGSKTKKQNDKVSAGDTANLQQYLNNAAKDKYYMGDTVRKSPLFTLLLLMVADSALLPGPVVGYVTINDVPKLAKLLANEAVAAMLPHNIRFVYGPPVSKTDSRLPLYVVKLPGEGDVTINGGSISDAKAGVGFNGKPDIHIRMSVPGTIKWKALTGRNINKYIAIVYDNQVFSCPRVADEISSGNTEISGDFTMESATDLANIFRSGKLLLPVRIIESNINE